LCAILDLLCLALSLVVLVHPGPAAAAMKAIDVTNNDADRTDISSFGETLIERGDTLQLDTVAGSDGITQRFIVPAATPGTNPAWFVFALRNATDKPVERWLTADRYATSGSGVVWPDLDARRVERVTPSVGYVPERVKNDRADVFRVSLEPGQTVTFAAELAGDRPTRLYLWKAVEYEQKSRDRQLFNGIMLGITGLLATFLTAVFAANHKAIFPSAAAFTWCVLMYLCVDFGFWHKLFTIRPEENGIYRAATEAGMAATLLVFLHTFLRLGAWHGFIRMLIALWMLAQFSLVAIAFIDPRLAATFARLSALAIALVGAGLTLFLSLRGQDRALSLVPTWMLLLVWLFGTGATLVGKLSGDIIVFGLTAGLVLLVVLIGFTVTQYAFRSIEPLYGAAPGEQQLRSLAVDGAGAAVWEWNARREEIKVSPVVEAILGLNAGDLSCKTADFAKHMHPADAERFKLLLWSVQERGGGELRIEFRMRHADNSYRWFELEAASVPSQDRRAVRCVGLLREVTESKRAQDRLLHDAVNDSLTGLPNRELFLDRLAIAAKRAALEPLVRPALLFIDIDRFKSVNASFGLVVGDSLLLTVARRLGRNLGPQDTLGRVGGDQFALLLLSQSDPRELALLAEQVRRSLRAPIQLAGQEIVLTASIGISLYDGPDDDSAELLREAEIAMYRAKRSGADRIEIFNAEMRSDKDGRPALESDLRKAIEKKQIRLLYQPIFYLPTESLAGFETLLRWEHPRLGTLNPTHFIPVAEESDLIVKLGSYVLGRAVHEAQRWQQELVRPDAPVFVSVNVSSRQLFRPDLVNEVRHILGRAVLPKGSLCLEVTEALVMENPEKATQVLSQLAAAGASLALDDFGTGYSSLSYLNQFTFDTIKVDRAFIQASGQNGTGSVILRSIVALSHELGKKVVAEGVETEEDVGFLRSINCEYGQGFYYGEPMSEREVMQLLRVVRKAERRMKKGLFRRSRMPEMPAMQAAAAEPETAVEPRVPIPSPEQRPAAPVSNGAALPIAPATRARPPLPPRPAGPVQAAPMQASAGKRSLPGGPALPDGPALPGGPPLPIGRTPPTMSSSRPMPPPIPGARQAAVAGSDAAKVNLPPSPLRPGATPASSATATLAAALEQQPQAANGTAANGNGATGTRARPGPPPLPRATAPEPPRTGDGPSRPEPRPTPTPPRPAPRLTPQQLRSNGDGPNGKPGPDLSKLPPNIAESLAKLAGRANVPFLGADTPSTPAADTAETGGKPQRDT
jgi:diguanylate cyclase (GGDEF)-like protein/PAS domain S-box-containing protein